MAKNNNQHNIYLMGRDNARGSFNFCYRPTSFNVSLNELFYFHKCTKECSFAADATCYACYENLVL